MTIAAAFICNDGVLLGADTEITYSDFSKAYESKILDIHHNVDLYLTYAGSPYFVREIIESVKKATGLLHNPVDIKPSPDECFNLLCGTYQTAYEREQQKPQEEAILTELLVAVRRDMHHLFKAEYEYRTTVYHLAGKDITPIDRYAVIGIGRDAARTLFDPFYQKFSLTTEGAFAMINAIRRTKASVPGCGGSSNILTIRNSGDWPVSEIGQDEIKQIEADQNFLDENLRNLYEWMPSSISDEGFEYNFNVLKRRIAERRSQANRLKIP